MNQPIETPAASLSPSRPRVWIPRLLVIAMMALAAIFAGRMGLRLRHWMWDTTVPIRFVSDINRGYGWGRLCATEGYLNQYEKMQPEQPRDENWLDDGPLGLGVMALWGKWSLTHYPAVNSWDQDQSYALTAPVLGFNLFMEIVGLVSAFFLTRLWVVRSQASLNRSDPSLRYFFRGCVPAAVAALLVWFNPAIVLSAYGWPTWDLWIVPLFLLAALMGSLDLWFIAGLVIGIGAMFKGQQLLAVPVFVLWSLLLFQPLSSLKFLSGVVFAVALVTLPWLLSFIPPRALAHARDIQAVYGQPANVPAGTFKLARSLDLPAIIWVLGTLVCAAAFPWIGWLRLTGDNINLRWKKVLRLQSTWRAIAGGAAFIWVIWPWLLKRNHPQWEFGLLFGSLMAVSVLLIRPRGIRYLAAGSVGLALLLCMSVFHGSSAWYDCGLHFGTIHWPWMTMGLTDNLPGILSADFNWPADDLTVTAITIPAHLLFHYPAEATELSIKTVLAGLFWITFIPCCVGVGLHARRRDNRVLIALTAPWLMFFCFCPQMHERYLLFASGISCICAGAGAGMTLLGILLTIITFLMTLNTMLDSASESARSQLSQSLAGQFPSVFGENAAEKLRSIANGTHPDLGYAVILCALIFLYFSLALRRTQDRLQVL